MTVALYRCIRNEGAEIDVAVNAVTGGVGRVQSFLTGFELLFYSQRDPGVTFYLELNGIYTGYQNVLSVFCVLLILIRLPL